MPTKTEKSFSLLFIFLLALEIITSSFKHLQIFNYIAKPALLISLILFFWKQSSHLEKNKTANCFGFNMLSFRRYPTYVHKPFCLFFYGWIACFFNCTHFLCFGVFKTKEQIKKRMGFYGIDVGLWNPFILLFKRWFKQLAVSCNYLYGSYFKYGNNSFFKTGTGCKKQLYPGFCWCYFIYDIG